MPVQRCAVIRLSLSTAVANGAQSVCEARSSVCCLLVFSHLQVLPDMSEWVDFGPAKVNGRKAHMWQLKDMAGEKVNT